MKISPLFMERWPFETIHCLNVNTQRQKRHDVTYLPDLRICQGARKTCCFLLAYFFTILCMCAMEFAEQLTLIHFCIKFASPENDWPYFKNSDSCLGKIVAMETYGKITKI